ncbi:ABC transporter permease [Aliidongia dinghuensis]|uniref:ABC transporter permease n=1 Tax=Aliidongia dinghuensis TaxID=1867774 RepID=A0A8J2YT80_9PROT|nr:ABC transporter substrate-binding protein [Aliidongia dinghuensis]GGF15474.1 ABC transporter permease [Aliidongia dinghuensis]
MVSAGMRAAAIVAAMAIASGAAAADGGVKIGVLSDMDGLYSGTAGPGSVEAARMAIEDFGGQALGKPIELVSASHQNKADVGAAITRGWFERDHVDAIFDLNNSAVALAVANLARAQSKVVVYTGTASSALTNEACAPTTVHYVYDTYALASNSARAVVAGGGKTWFMVAADYAFGKMMTENVSDVVAESGGKMVGTVYHPLDTADFSSFLLQAQSSGADVVALGSATHDMVNAVTQARQFAITPAQKLVAMLVFIQDVHALGLERAQGMTFTTGFYWDRTEATRTWSKRFFERMKTMPSMIHAGTYSAVMHYLQAVSEAGTTDGPTVAETMKRLPIHDFFAENGHIRPDGRMVHDMYVVTVKSPAESKYPWDYYKILATIPADEAFQPLAKSSCPLVKK